LTNVTVVLPSFNESKEICSAIEEIHKQTYKDFEAIIVDDGSKDNTVELATACIRDKPEFRIVEQQHGGLTHARNTGIREARGEIVFFAEADCVYDDSYLEKAVKALEQNPDSSAVCLTGAPLKLRTTVATNSIEIENFVQHRLLSQGKIKPFYAWVFKTDVLRKLGGYDEKLFQGEDKDMFRRFISAGYKVAWVPGIHWRHKRDQTTADMAKKTIKRFQSRADYVTKHRLITDLARGMGPLWLLLLGIGLVFFYPIVGILLVVIVFAALFALAANNIRISWPLVQRKREYFGYLLYVIVRNFSTGIGYTIGLTKIFWRKLARKKENQMNLQDQEKVVEETIPNPK
jgi:biofilm PGA synthesis N-glycosyltransferase PgaC